MRLSGKRALVTGGAQGIGAAIAQAFRDEGADVFTCGRRAHDADGWFMCDVSNAAQVAGMMSEIGTLDVLVNNAGVQIEKTVVDSTDDDWEMIVGPNCRGVFNCCRAAIPAMTKGGSIINIGSISGNVADPSMALYNASKAFVHGLTRSIAVDHGPQVRCNAICPGWIETGMLEAGFAQADDPAAARADALGRHAAGRFGKPQDIAAMAVWLASDEAAFATGQLFTVDGGLTAASPIAPGGF